MSKGRASYQASTTMTIGESIVFKSGKPLDLDAAKHDHINHNMMINAALTPLLADTPVKAATKAQSRLEKQYPMNTTTLQQKLRKNQDSLR